MSILNMALPVHLCPQVQEVRLRSSGLLLLGSCEGTEIQIAIMGIYSK